jgi:predicted Zn-dependent protease
MRGPHKLSKRLGWYAAAGALLASGLLIPACATNPVTGERQFNLMSEAQEIQIGQEMDPQVQREMGIYEDRELQQYLESVAVPLARGSQRPNLPWHFSIVDSPAVNAFALPGGYIYVTRGLLAHLNDESELAGVLGHEIGHVTARHAAQQYSKSTGASLGLAISSIFLPATRGYGQLAESGLGLLFLKYGREDELQADRLGAQYAAQNGWDPEGVQDMLRTLARLDETATDKRGVPNYLSTHPQPADRVQKIDGEIATLRASAGERQFKTERPGYLRRIDGVVFGENPREGVVRGNEFLHPDMRFAVSFPAGWEIQNGKTQVVAKAPGAQLYMLLDLVQQPQGANLQDIALNDMNRAGFRALQGGDTTINGLRAFVGTFQGSMQSLGQVVARVAYVPLGRSLFRFAGIAQANTFSTAEDEFSASVRTFRELSAKDADSIRPNRIDLYTVRAGETWQSIAQGPSGGNIQASTLAIINNFPPNEQPRPGDRIKIVVST